MAKGPAVGDVAIQETLKIEERYDGYRVALASALRDLLKQQDFGAVEQARRKRIEERINDLASKVMHGKGQS
jgi:predicted SPOUT superfamily RNA methylase MTH1